MTNTPTYELLTTGDDVLAYLQKAGIIARVANSLADVEVTEVTAGNMNRVFIARGPLGSVAIKQAPPWVQVAGPEWPIDPARIASEARAYELLATVVPEIIPTIEAVDLDRYVLVMEDLSDLSVLRDVMVAQVADIVAGRTPIELDFAAIGTAVGRFSAELSLATSRVSLSAEAHAELVKTAANPELCALTDAVVMDEPYRVHEHNHWAPEVDAAVQALYSDHALLEAAKELRATFATRAEALIHGDLHSGSVMVGLRDARQTVKVFDPEFSFVGPIGLDLGLFWANMTIAALAAKAVGASALAASRQSAISSSWREFSRIVTERWPNRVASPDGLDLADWLTRIRADAWGFAGSEAIRRVAGFAHAADVTALPAELVGPADAELLSRAHGWILNRTDAASTTPITLTASTLVVDLEGTTSAAGFILGDLYDYARPRLAGYLDANRDKPLIAEARAQIIADASLPRDASTTEIVAVLHDWMDSDVKATPLKTIQGQIWAEGFAAGEIRSHFFDDVIDKLRQWHDAGVAIAVFSSGSVASQVPWFRHSPGGDLSPLIMDYFDTVNAGSKKLASSYEIIANSLSVPASDIVFFTDHPEEVTAARRAGWAVVAFSREGEPWFGTNFGDVPVAQSFEEITFSVPATVGGIA